MANPKHVALLNAGVKTWNHQRPDKPDLSGAALSKRNLEGVDLSRANLEGADLLGANLRNANLSDARLRRANLWRCKLRGAALGRASFFKADLSGAELVGGKLAKADLYRVNFTAAMLAKADLSGARLEKATLVAANLRGANLSFADLTECSLSRANVQDCDFTGARIYGAGIWDCRGKPKSQNGLVITRRKESPITVDNLKLGQFVYLLLTNPDIRDVIDTITSKAVLILGNFSKDRKPVLDAMREAMYQWCWSDALLLTTAKSLGTPPGTRLARVVTRAGGHRSEFRTRFVSSGDECAKGSDPNAWTVRATPTLAAPFHSPAWLCRSTGSGSWPSAAPRLRCDHPGAGT